MDTAGSELYLLANGASMTAKPWQCPFMINLTS